MSNPSTPAPDSTAVRTALWRALHVELDAAPPAFDDTVGLRLAGEEKWRERPDMNPGWTRGLRASMAARARFVEELVTDASAHGVDQYVLLGAGLDTFSQRRPDVASRLRIFEVDRPGPQAWKKARLQELGYGLPSWLCFVPVDFEAGSSWWDELRRAGFDSHRRAIVASVGVSMYLTQDAVNGMLEEVATLAPGSTFAMTFLLPTELVAPEDQAMAETAKKGAKSSGTPFVSFFSPDEVVSMAREAGFENARHVSSSMLGDRYFANRTDGLRPATGEDFLVATT